MASFVSAVEHCWSECGSITLVRSLWNEPSERPPHSLFTQPPQADGSAAFKSYNTDWAAAIGAIEQEMRAASGSQAGPAASSQPSPSEGLSPLAGKTFLVVGAGGAGRALAFGAASKWVAMHVL
eukprot:1159783-Pelagomonas_calceolata.AAC.19